MHMVTVTRKSLIFSRERPNIMKVNMRTLSASSMLLTQRAGRARTGRRRLLGSGAVDLLVGPHGIDRYLELIDPRLTIKEARAEVVDVQHQTARSVTLKLRANHAWEGFRAGQFVRVGVEIDGVRRTRTFSPAGSEHAADGELELTVTLREGGLVSNYLRRVSVQGSVLYLSQAQGEFVLSDERPQRLVLISGGSGITPLMAILRTLCDEGYGGEIAFVHYARTREDWLYRPAVEALAASHPGLHLSYLATREGDGHLAGDALPSPLNEPAWRDADVAVCGPASLIEAVRAAWSHAPERVRSETFTAPRLLAAENATEGTVHFLASQTATPIADGTLLELAERAGLKPEFGCRLGICKTCTCRKSTGAVKNLISGAVSDEDDEAIQLCVSVPVGDVALDL